MNVINRHRSRTDIVSKRIGLSFFAIVACIFAIIGVDATDAFSQTVTRETLPPVAQRNGRSPGVGNGEFNQVQQMELPYQLDRHRIHLYVGGHLSGLLVVDQSGDLLGTYIGHGAGLGLHLGGRLGAYFSAETRMTYSFNNETQSDPDDPTVDYLFDDSLYILNLEGIGKFHIPTRYNVEPYLEAGIGIAWLGDSGRNGIITKGPSFRGGFGLDFWMTPNVSFGLEASYRALAFGEPDVKGLTVPAGYTPESDTVHGIEFGLNVDFHF